MNWLKILMKVTNMNFDLDLGVIANNCDQSVKYGNSFQDFQKNSTLDFEIMVNDQGIEWEK